MDATSLETVSRWAGAAAVVLSVLAAIAISIAAYASSRLAAGTSVRTEIAPAHEVKADDQPAGAEPVVTTGTAIEPPPLTAGPLRGTRPAASSEDSAQRPRESRNSPGDRHTAVTMLQTALSPPQVELTWVADPDSYPRAKEIEQALAEAGWTVMPAGSVLLASEPTATSLTAGVLSDETLLLRKALEATGLKLTMLFDPAMPPDRVRLMIGNDQ
jgi:hypothetical protein